MPKGAIGSGKMTSLVWKIKALNISFVIGVLSIPFFFSWNWLIIGLAATFFFEVLNR